ncbi:MAG: amidohydrolase family protein [Bryobacteraceae bacterium]
MWLSEMEAELRKQAQALNLFDASSWLGRTTALPLMDEGTPELLGRVHKESFIRGALVSHWRAGQDCSQESNRLLLRQIADRDNWYATLSLQPLLPVDPDSPASPKWVWPTKVRAVRVFPSSFQYPLVDWCVGSLCEMLIERRLPLFVLHTETTFQDLYALASRYPKLRIVIESQTRKILYHMRAVLPLMKACPNIHLETSNLCAQGMVEYIVKNLGADRLIFGTFAPANDPIVPLGMLLQADISQADKLAIAGDNMRRLIAKVQR